MMDNENFNEFIPSVDQLYNENENDSVLNKENFDFSTPIEKSKPRSSRMSILQCLDPLNPYSPKCKIQPAKLQEDIQEAMNDSKSKANDSWNFFTFDNAENCNSPLKKNLNLTPFDSCQDDIFCFSSENINKPVKNLNESLFLDSSIEDDKVNIDNLISISPMKQFVDKSVHNKLKKLYHSKTAEWLEAEKRYQEEIETLRKHNEVQLSLVITSKDEEIRDLMKENELKTSEMCNDFEKKLSSFTSKKESIREELLSEYELKISELEKEKECIINDLVKENEENLENLRSKNSKLILEKQNKIDCLSEKLKILEEESIYLNSSKASDKLIIDQYYDVIDEIIHQHEEEKSEFIQDNATMENLLNKYMNKYNSSVEIVISLKKNVEVLKEQIAKCELKITQLEVDVETKSVHINEIMENSEKEIKMIKGDLDRQLKKKDMRIAILENNELNLNRELELRISERDRYKDTLAKYAD